MQALSPAITIITFDLHGVLFKTDYQQLARLIWQSKHKKKIIAHMFHPTFWYSIWMLFRRASPIEQDIMELTDRWPKLASCRQELIAMANAQRPNKAMIELAQSLKNEGYALHIFSNIGTIILTDLQQQHVKLFSMFDHIFTTSAALGYPSKKNPCFFRYYLDSYAGKKKNIILIDDSRKNIKIGITFGMLGIYAKNTHYVQSALKKLGVLA